MRSVSGFDNLAITPLISWILVFGHSFSSASPHRGKIEIILQETARPYSVLMAESVVNRGQGMGLKNDNEPYINYEHGTFQHALWDMYTQNENKTYLTWIREGIDNIVTPAGKIVGGYDTKAYILDDVRVMESMIHLYQVTQEDRYKIAAGVLQQQMKTQPRTAEGAFWFVFNPLAIDIKCSSIDIQFLAGIKNDTLNSNGSMVFTWLTTPTLSTL